MRAIFAALLTLSATPAFAQEEADSSPSLEVTASVQDKWVFPNQLLTQADAPAAEFSATLSVDDWSVNLWYGRELQNPNNSELDVLLSPPELTIAENVLLDATVGIYFIPGREAAVAEVGISVPVAKNWTLRASLQGVRGGFEENLIKLEAPGSIPLSDTVVIDLTPAIFYSDYAGAAGVSLSAGASYRLNDNLDIRAFATGYAGGGRSDIAFGASVTIRR